MRGGEVRLRGGKGRGGEGRDITAESVKDRRFCGGTRRSDRRFRLHLIVGKCNAVVKWVIDEGPALHSRNHDLDLAGQIAGSTAEICLARGKRESSDLSDLAGERFRWGFRAQIIADLCFGEQI